MSTPITPSAEEQRYYALKDKYEQLYKENKIMREALAVYKKVDDEHVKLMAGFKVTPNMENKEGLAHRVLSQVSPSPDSK